jgi:hypothetical protein
VGYLVDVLEFCVEAFRFVMGKVFVTFAVVFWHNGVTSLVHIPEFAAPGQG